MKDPEVYLTALELAVPCAVSDYDPARLDAEHRSYVNWEVYFFSNLARKAEFEDDPLRYCGTVSDPVSKERFSPTTASPRYDYNGRPYYFSSQATMATFRTMPDSLAQPSSKMLPKGS